MTAIALSACGIVGGGADRSASNAGTAAPPAAASSEAPPATPSSSPEADRGTRPGLQAVTSAVGPVVTNVQGRTMYRFEKDTPKPSKSACYQQCSQNFPPVEWNPDWTVEGIDAGLLGKLARTDGITQLTINGWPVYYHAKDTRAGEMAGHGLNKTWYAITPDGRKAGQPASQGTGY